MNISCSPTSSLASTASPHAPSLAFFATHSGLFLSLGEGGRSASHLLHALGSSSNSSTSISLAVSVVWACDSPLQPGGSVAAWVNGACSWTALTSKRSTVQRTVDIEITDAGFPFLRN
jgi:hypothetical protein